MLMGDFNGVMDTRLDRSSSALSHAGLPKQFKYWLNDRGLTGVVYMVTCRTILIQATMILIHG